MYPMTLCLVTHVPSNRVSGEYFDRVRQAIAGGVTAVQLRDKSLHKQDIQTFAQALKAILSPYQVPLLLNDHVDIAKAIDADGVHLGQTDTDPVTARTLLGADKWIGLSIETLDELHCANALSCIDYVAASAVFPSQTKTNCKTIWGLEGLRTLSSLSKHPVIAIGGITEHNARDVMAHGARGVAVISHIHGAKDPKLAANKLIQAMKEPQ